jgi:predicted NUDIX family NTP pyrophosphohydrolase
VAKRSAGLLMYRRGNGGVEVFLVHPGGPFWAKKDLGAWTVPKGQYDESEPALDAAKREFEEETGVVPRGNFVGLGEVRQPSGKIVSAWAFEGDCDPDKLTSNLCQFEWPPRSGRFIEIPEVDRGAWFSMTEARARIRAAQQPFLDRLLRELKIEA